MITRYTDVMEAMRSADGNVCQFEGCTLPATTKEVLEVTGPQGPVVAIESACEEHFDWLMERLDSAREAEPPVV